MTQDNKKVELKISGMHCATCAVTLEKGLSNMPGVTAASVNFGTGKAMVEYDPAVTNLAGLAEKTELTGYGVIPEEITISIGGMHCAMCAQAIEKALQKHEGVLSASVNLANERGFVTYIPSLVTPGDLKQIIEDTGYQYLGTGETKRDLEEALFRTELSDKRNRVILGFVVSGLLMLMMLAPEAYAHQVMYLQFIIATPVFLYLGYPIFRAAYISLKNRALNMDVMYAMGIGVAYCASLLGTFGIILDMSYIFYETAIMLTAFLMLGRYLEARAKGQTTSAIRSLVKLQADAASVIREEKEIKIPADEIQVGDKVLVRTGERIPADGIIISGNSFIDEAMITGEPVPVEKKSGDTVIGGTLPTTGMIVFRAEQVGADTMLHRIIRMVEEAQNSRPDVQRIADHAVTWFIPTVLLISILASAYWFFIAGAGLRMALQTLIAILVVACPCALGLATPTAITVGVGRAAELGILIRNGEALEVSDSLTSIFFDKTGTITEGRPRVTDIDLTTGSVPLLLSSAASLEDLSLHPLGSAIVEKARAEKIEPADVDNFEYISGKGVQGRIAGRQVIAGNMTLIEESGTRLTDEQHARIRSRQEEGKTTVLVTADGELLGVISIADTIKPEAQETIRMLQEMKIQSMLITGDNKRTAEATGRQVGITNIRAGVLPEEKGRVVAQHQEKGEVVAFVGDGINDAPALAQSDVGIAIGTGTDVAIESADIVLVRGDLKDAVAAVQLAQKVMGRVKLNLFWAFAYNIVLIPLAAGLLYPVGILFRPEYGALAMAFSSVTVVSLSLMLKRYLPPVLIPQKKRKTPA